MFPVPVDCTFICFKAVLLSQFMKENNSLFSKNDKLHLLTYEFEHLVYVHITGVFTLLSLVVWWTSKTAYRLFLEVPKVGLV